MVVVQALMCLCFVQIIQGEYDDTLTWPYTGTVTYEIIDRKGGINHVKRIVDFSQESARAEPDPCGIKPTSENSNSGWGNVKVLPHNETLS